MAKGRRVVKFKVERLLDEAVRAPEVRWKDLFEASKPLLAALEVDILNIVEVECMNVF